MDFFGEQSRAPESCFPRLFIYFYYILCRFFQWLVSVFTNPKMFLGKKGAAWDFSHPQKCEENVGGGAWQTFSAQHSCEMCSPRGSFPHSYKPRVALRQGVGLLCLIFVRRAGSELPSFAGNISLLGFEDGTSELGGKPLETWVFGVTGVISGLGVLRE